MKTEVTHYTGDVNVRKRMISNLYRIIQYILIMGRKKILLCDEHRLRCIKFWTPPRASLYLQTHLDLLQDWLRTWRIKVNETKSAHVTLQTEKLTAPQSLSKEGSYQCNPR